MVIFIVLLIILSLLIGWFFIFELKIFHLNAVNLITGAVKSGKSALSLDLAYKTYRLHLLRFYIHYFLTLPFSLFGLSLDYEKPLFYSNIPVKFRYVELERALLLREKRFNYKSVVFIDEMSLIADNFDFKDDNVNKKLKKFFKLFGHETRGGKLFVNTQNLEDNHFIVKRCMNQYLYIHHKIRLPFISILKVRELSNEPNMSNVNLTDIESELKTYILFNRIFKKYDCYCYSILTDNLEAITHSKIAKTLKSLNILSFNSEDEKK